MAETTTTIRRNNGIRSILEVCAYAAAVLIGLAMLLSRVVHMSPTLAANLQYVAMILSYIVVGALSFFFAVRRGRPFWQSLLWFGLWLVAITLIIIFTFWR